MSKEMSREELFLLVWQRPSREIAKELGISHAELSKRCRQLQVPMPPPRYWVKAKAGLDPKKLPLEAFNYQLAEWQNKQSSRHKHSSRWLHFTPLQIEILGKATQELRSAGVDFDEVNLNSSCTEPLGSDAASRYILVIQNHYLKWLKERSNTGRVAQASIRSVQSLISKLLPLAASHTLVLGKRQEKHDSGSKYPKVIVRLTPEFRQQIAHLHRMVVENNLVHVAWDLNSFEHAWVVQYHYHHASSISANSHICISRTGLWLISTINQHRWCDDIEETHTSDEVPISEISPVELLKDTELTLPTTVALPKLSLSKERVQAFLDAEQALDILSSALHKSELQRPADHLVLFEKLLLSAPLGGPITNAQKMIKKFEENIERWELVMESERAAICSDALGITVGDTILTQLSGKPVRLKVSQMSTHISEANTLCFSIAGKRYRKDGILGKRNECVYIETSMM
ncbi:hypothetical protein N9241_00930 [bacterium]|nr:hypothetical protein [bacterium]